MKCIIFAISVSLSVLSLAASNSGAASVNYTDYAALLSEYVNESGIAYAEWFDDKEDLAKLESVLADFSSVEVSALNRSEQKAFYINLYNAGMIQAVFEAYPIDSVKDIGLIPFSVFKKDFIEQGTRLLSLDGIEKEILLKEYPDPRIHFAVNCASESCPPLRVEPFVGDRLEAQLDDQTRGFANSERALQIDPESGKHAYSSLFDWYAKDFGVKHPGEYLNRYREVALNLQSDFKWIPYDWSLNTAE